MGKIFREYLSKPIVYCCEECTTHMASAEDIVSKAFNGRFGQAILFKTAINFEIGPVRESLLSTGKHEIADVHCIYCHHYLGWQYIDAADDANKYKIGKVILEQNRTTKVKQSDVHGG